MCVHQHGIWQLLVASCGRSAQLSQMTTVTGFSHGHRPKQFVALTLSRFWVKSSKVKVTVE